MNVKQTFSSINSYRKRYERELTAMNVFGITVFSLFLLVECAINKKNKYQIIGSLKENLNIIFGEQLHQTVVFPFLMFLHFIFTVSFLANIFLTESLLILSLNVMMLCVVAVLNLLFKGCIAHKYEKAMLGKYVKLVTFFEVFFIPYTIVFNKPPTLQQKVVFVHLFYFIAFVLIGGRFLSLLSK